MIRDDIIAGADGWRAQFQTARPFRHACIEGFFDPDIAEQALADFPGFDSEAARNEFGEIGGKAVNTDLPRISPFYARLSEYLVSDRFTAAMSALTGIPDLKADVTQFGGGTHENLHGQSLDPHVDFNYDMATGRHRRLNLLVYLNKDWDEAWGGCIELHSNPRDPAADESVAFAPDFNRAVLFETNEHSWHGFRRIEIPGDAPTRSRKCLSIYLYTETRPDDEIAPPHGTFYVPPPLPDRIAEGRTLTADDMSEIRDRLERWSHWLEFHQKRELDLSGQVEDLRRHQQIVERDGLNHGVRHHAAALLREAWSLSVAVVNAALRLGGLKR
jgi:hypothetical protein